MIDFIIYSVLTILLCVILASFLFKRYFNIAKTYNLYKGFNNRSSHKGNVYTGSGILLAFMLLVATIFFNHISIFDFSSINSTIKLHLLLRLHLHLHYMTIHLLFHLYILL